MFRKNALLTSAMAAVLLLLVPALTQGRPLKIVATVPDLAWLAQELGGDRVEVTALCRGYQDPHYLEAKPSYARELRKADLLLYVGLELEVAWLPRLLETARNPSLRPGSVNLLNASSVVERILEIPVGKVNRSEGDVHPLGNPHYLLDPRNLIPLSKHVTERLTALDPEGGPVYQERLAHFQTEMRQRLDDWSSRAASLRGGRIVAFHKQWEYLADWLGLEITGYVENRPGVPSTPRHVNGLIQNMKAQGVIALIAAPFVDVHAAKEVAQRAGSPFLILPAAVGGGPETDTYPLLMETLLQALLSTDTEGGSR